MLSNEILIADSWMKIIFRDKSIGYSHTSMDVNENDPIEHYAINNRVHVAFNVLGVRKNIHALTAVLLDSTYNLRRFTFSLSSPAARAKVEGVRVDGDNFNVTISSDSVTDTLRVQVPPDIVIYSPVTDTTIKNLKPGQQLTIRTMDPLSLKKTGLVVRALRKEKLKVSGAETDSTVLGTDYHGIQVLSWIDDKGSMLREESPIGWVMEKCTPEEAYDAALGTKGSDELLKSLLPLLFIGK
jgi:hypothetical protein